MGAFVWSTLSEKTLVPFPCHNIYIGKTKFWVETQAYRCYRSPRDGVLVFVRWVSGTCTGEWSLNPCASFDSVDTQRITHLFFVEAPSDDWSDSEDEEVENADPSRKIKILEKRLALAQQSLVDYRTLITEKCNIPNLIKDINEPISRQVASTSRDDDTHYFQSYGEHGQPTSFASTIAIYDLFVTRYPRSHDPG